MRRPENPQVTAPLYDTNREILQGCRIDVQTLSRMARFLGLVRPTGVQLHPETNLTEVPSEDDLGRIGHAHEIVMPWSPPGRHCLTPTQA